MSDDMPNLWEWVEKLEREVRLQGKRIDEVLLLHGPMKLQPAVNGVIAESAPVVRLACRGCSDPDFVAAYDHGDLIDIDAGVTYPCLTRTVLTGGRDE